MVEKSLYATPRDVNSTEQCIFYHSMEIPGYGKMDGMWDLRPNVDKYLARVNLEGKRVLDVGAASGYLCFHMESQGAKVIGFDLSAEDQADVVPFARIDHRQRVVDMQPWLEQVKNGFWLAHKAFNSQVRVVYGNVYAIPEEIGPVDATIFGAILLHLRDPFLALQNGLRLTKETVIISEPVWNWVNFLRYLLPAGRFGDLMLFVPDAELCEPSTTWWHIAPSAIRRFIAVLGFENSRVTYHFQQHEETSKRVPFYTIVGRRTVPMPELTTNRRVN